MSGRRQGVVSGPDARARGRSLAEFLQAWRAVTACRTRMSLAGGPPPGGTPTRTAHESARCRASATLAGRGIDFAVAGAARTLSLPPSFLHEEPGLVPRR